MNSIVVLPFIMTNESAGIPLHIKSLGCTIDGSTGSLTSTSKSVGGVVTMLRQPALTEQDVGVGVGVGVGDAVGVAVGVGVTVAVGVGVGPAGQLVSIELNGVPSDA